MIGSITTYVIRTNCLDIRETRYDIKVLTMEYYNRYVCVWQYGSSKW